MNVLPEGQTRKGGEPYFSGEVYFDVLVRGEPPSAIRVNLVRFSPGARTAWHRHALGQTLHVVDGVAHMQARGGPVIEVHAGQTVYTPPGEWHWHGASPGRFMSHLAMWDGVEKDETEWGEHPTGAAEEIQR